MVAIFSATDRQIVLNEAVTLPIIGVEVPITTFYVLATLLLAALFIYLQLYLDKIRRLVETTNHEVENSRIYPWVVNLARYDNRGLIGGIQAASVWATIWLLLPLTILLFWIQSLTAQSYFLSYALGVGFIVSAFISTFFWARFAEQDELLNRGQLFFLAGCLVLGGFGLSDTVPRALNGEVELAVADLSFQVLVEETGYDSPSVNFYQRNLNGINFGSSILNGADFRSAKLVSANLEDANLSHVDGRGANFRASSLRGATADSSNLEDTDLSSTNLWHATFRGANLQKANLYKAMAGYADMSSADMTGACMDSTNFEVARFTEANLNMASLRGSYLGRTDFDGANLFAADLRGARLDYSTFRNADLGMADLDGSYYVNILVDSDRLIVGRDTVHISGDSLITQGSTEPLEFIENHVTAFIGILCQADSLSEIKPKMLADLTRLGCPEKVDSMDLGAFIIGGLSVTPRGNVACDNARMTGEVK